MTTPVGAVGPVAGVLIEHPDPGAVGRHGGPANPAHGQWTWEDPAPVPWVFYDDPNAGVADFDQSLIGELPEVLPAGADPLLIAEATETGSHAAPWPSFGINDGLVHDRGAQAERNIANAELHSLDTGGPAWFTTTIIDVAEKMPWEAEADYVSPGQTILQPVPGQMQGLMGRDRVQGTPALNDYGFDSAHVNRPRAVGDVPGNFLWLDGREQRPMTIQIAGHNGRFAVGADSPFEGQTPGVGGVGGAVLTGLPSGYNPPVQPPIAAAAAAADEPAWSTW